MIITVDVSIKAHSEVPEELTHQRLAREAAQVRLDYLASQLRQGLYKALEEYERRVREGRDVRFIGVSIEVA